MYVVSNFCACYKNSLVKKNNYKTNICLILPSCCQRNKLKLDTQFQRIQEVELFGLAYKAYMGYSLAKDLKL